MKRFQYHIFYQNADNKFTRYSGVVMAENLDHADSLAFSSAPPFVRKNMSSIIISNLSSEEFGIF